MSTFIAQRTFWLLFVIKLWQIIGQNETIVGICIWAKQHSTLWRDLLSIFWPFISTLLYCIMKNMHSQPMHIWESVQRDVDSLDKLFLCTGWTLFPTQPSNSLKPDVCPFVHPSIRPSARITFWPEWPFSPPQELERSPPLGLNLLVTYDIHLMEQRNIKINTHFCFRYRYQFLY